MSRRVTPIATLITFTAASPIPFLTPLTHPPGARADLAIGLTCFCVAIAFSAALFSLASLASRKASSTIRLTPTHLEIRRPGKSFRFPITDITGLSTKQSSENAINASLLIQTPLGTLNVFPNELFPSAANQLVDEISVILGQLPPAADSPIAVAAGHTTTRTRRSFLVCSLLGLSVAIYFLIGVRQGLSTWSWTPTPATITAQTYEITGTGNDQRITAELSYHYTTAGQPHDSDQTSLGLDLQTRKDFVAAHPVGSPATAYINPHNPSEAVLLQGVPALNWIFVSMLLPTIPGLLHFAQRRSTPAKDALLRRYQHHFIASDSLNSPTKITWTTSATHASAARRQALRMTFWMGVRMTLMSLASVALVLFLFRSIYPPGIWKAIVVIGGLTLFVSWSTFIAVWITPIRPTTFTLTSQYIQIGATRKRLAHWKHFQTFDTAPSEFSADTLVLTLRGKSGTTRCFPLPADNTDSILAAVARHLPATGPSQPIPPQPFSKRQWIASFTFCALLGIAIALVTTAPSAHPLQGAASTILALGLLVGPGSLLAFALRNRRPPTTCTTLFLLGNYLFVTIFLLTQMLLTKHHLGI